jgi:hypothetical protein
MRSILSFILIVLAVAAVLAVGGSLLVLLAYGVGRFLRPFLPFSIFEDTVISLAGISLMGILVARILGVFLSSPFSPLSKPLADADEEDEDLDDEDYEEEDEYEEPAYANTHPESRCPCGSGRKYKNCHGRHRRA